MRISDWSSDVCSSDLPGMPAYEEELFGPVAAVLPAADEADAVRIANDRVFGLGGAVFTRDLSRGERLAREQLGRASCRARVCQYLYISVVAVSLNTKYITKYTSI